MKLLEIYKKQGGIDLLKQYMRSGSLGLAISQYILLGKSRTALEILRLSTQLKNKKSLTRKYRKAFENIEKKYTQFNLLSTCQKKRIWVCWLQGIKAAPLIVQKCFQSLKDNLNGREIILITDENYKDYIQFPPEIQQKIDNGIIKGAHMTDLLRLELLSKYGGTWIDATVYCSSSNIPEYMLDSDLFMFQCLKPGRDGHANIISNWFITASPNNKLLFFEKELLYEYWRKNNTLIDYFIFHEFFSIIVDRFPEEWNYVIPFSNSTPHILLHKLFEKYDEKTWIAIKNQTPFHKLTYKLSDNCLNTTGTFYDVLFDGSTKDIMKATEQHIYEIES